MIGGGHSLAVVKGVGHSRTVFWWEDLDFFEPAVNKSSVLRRGDDRPSLEQSLAVVTDLRGTSTLRSRPKVVFSPCKVCD